MMADDQPKPRIVGVGAVFIDDIVLPTGQTYMAQLGGGVVHALMGAAIWGERPGINAVIGNGLPDEALVRLKNSLDTTGLIRLDIPQIRAWQLFEEDSTRRELYRVKDVEPFIRGAQPPDLPTQYHGSQGYYLLQGFDGVRAWCATIKGIVLWEPLQQIMIPGNRATIRAILQEFPISIISPNLQEAEAVYGQKSPTEIINAIFDDGARGIALRMGEQGSIVAQCNSSEHLYIPAVPVKAVVDQTGAGNTYCGGLLWGLAARKTLVEAGAAGAVAASFCIEGVGVVNPGVINFAERDRRYQDCIAQMQSL
ncbi:MAG: PfkB family carbohydrate kinase [Chloroflexota bacterium]